MALCSGIQNWSRITSLTVKFNPHSLSSFVKFQHLHSLQTQAGRQPSLPIFYTSKNYHGQTCRVAFSFVNPSILYKSDLLHNAAVGYLPHYEFSRSFHSSSSALDKSKVEDSLKAKLKSKAETDAESKEGSKEVHTKPKSGEQKTVASKPEVKKPLWVRFVAEVKHYYHGFRLLALDVRIAAKTLWKNLTGKPVSRRERNQFLRALSDIFRLAPFSIFIIIPFAEIALPFAVKLFPGLLPSTFEDKTARDTRLRKELLVKLRMAKFMQDTVEEIAMRSKKSSKSNQATEDFANFFNKIRKSDEEPTNKEILKHAKLFEDELTLDSMTRPQLIALCRLIQVPAVGSNNLLRFLLQMKLKRLHDDDAMIQKEGIDSLTSQELQAACQARGMRAIGMSEQRLKNQLEQWIDLHLNHDVPSSLLLLSRVLFMPENVPVETRVKEAISALPEKVADEAEVRAAELNCERIDNTKRYKITKQEQLEIAREEAEEKKNELEKKLSKQSKESEEASKAKEKKAAQQTVVSAQPSIMEDDLLESQKVDAPSMMERIEHDTMRDITKAEEIRDEGPVLKDKSPILKEEITKEEIDALDKAFGNLAKEKEESLDDTKSELESLREDLVEYQQDVISLDKNLSSEEDEIVTKEMKASTRLQKSIGRLIGNMDNIVAELDKQKEKSPDGGDADKEFSISVEDLKTTLLALGEIPEEKLSGIVQLLDSNKDGNINLKEALAAIEVLESEDVSVTAEQLQQIITLLEPVNRLEKETQAQE